VIKILLPVSYVNVLWVHTRASRDLAHVVSTSHCFILRG